MKYQLSLWLKSDLGPDQVKKEIRDLETAFKSQADEKASFRAEILGKRKLAYKIKGFNDGFFVRIDLEVAKLNVADLITFLNREAGVLRYLLTKHETRNQKS